MAVLFSIKNRVLIPNWRDFKRTLVIGELSNTSSFSTKLSLNVDRPVLDWRQEKNLGTAADLITSAFVSGLRDSPEIVEAANFIADNAGKSSKSLLEIVSTINDPIESSKGNTSVLLKDVDSIEKFRGFFDDELFNELIRKTKSRARENLLSAVEWVELARLYSIIGQNHSADRAMSIALHLAPNNRFVLRSATRLYIHNENPEKALYHLRRAEPTKFDPWLLSAHIATSNLLDRFSPLLKNASNMMASTKFGDFDKTELASSLGTLEFKNGSFKKAKVLIDQSLIRPNDNSLAQLEWLSNEDARFKKSPFTFDHVINPFEAHALDFFNNGLWRKAFESSLNWYLDLPYSKRPVLLGSFIACCVTKDFEAAIMLCEVGLKSNPGDADILNNLIYAYAKAGKIQHAESYIKQFLYLFKNQQLDNENIIVFQATLGLMSFRLGMIDVAKKYYKEAIENAERIREMYLRNFAVVNFAHELLLVNDPEKDFYFNMVIDIKRGTKEVDLLALIDDLLALRSKIEQ
jgi:tetratricopeptide (TPR) repeat protein